MKKFIQENFTIIVLAISLLTFLKSCNDSRNYGKIQKEIQMIKDSSVTKKELRIMLQVEGLKNEKRMIQATDRKILDVNRQNEIDVEIKHLESSN